MECDICVQNPRNISKKFMPTKYKGITVNRPIDMYISREHKKLVDKEIEQTFEEGVRAGSLGLTWTGSNYQGMVSKMKIDNLAFQMDSENDTLSVTFTIRIEGNPVESKDLGIADSLGETKIEEKKPQKGRMIVIDIVDILKDMEGVEVGDETE